MAGQAVSTAVCSSTDAPPQTATGVGYIHGSGADKFGRLAAELPIIGCRYRESLGPMFLLAVSVQYKLAALETGFHFPYVVRVVSLRSVHCLTDIVLVHRRCLLGTTNEPKLEKFALRATPFLQPYVHEVILAPPSRSEVNDERITRSCRLDQP